MIVAYDVSTSLLSLIMSTLKHLNLIFGMSVDAELYGLQDGDVICLTIAIWYGRFVEMLDGSHFIACQKYGISVIWTLYWVQNEMASIQFCRASQDLSNGVWLKLKSEKISGEKIQISYLFSWKIGKNSVSEHFSILIISARVHFEKMSNTWFDAESNGLQTDIKFFLAIDFWPIHLVKILKNRENFIC
jgi:hypothetical protein